MIQPSFHFLAGHREIAIQPIPFHILGLGRCLPKRVVLSTEFDQKFGKPPGYIFRKTGVFERRYVDNETASDLGAVAAKEAVKNAGLTLSDVDLIVNASGTPVQAIPDGGPLLQRTLGLKGSGIPCFSIHSTCLSFVTALDLVAPMVSAGRYKNALIVSSEVASHNLDPHDWHDCSLFGDGSAAMLISPPTGEHDSAILATRMETYGEGFDLAGLEGCGSKNPPTLPHTTESMNYFHMKGIPLFRLVGQRVRPFLDKMVEHLSFSWLDVDWVVPHQASQATGKLLKSLGYDNKKIIMVLERLGNCVAASIPMALYEGVQSGRIKHGDSVLLVGTGAGVSMQGIVLRY